MLNRRHYNSSYTNKWDMKDETHACYDKVSTSESIEKIVKSIVQLSSPNYCRFHKTYTISF